MYMNTIQISQKQTFLYESRKSNFPTIRISQNGIYFNNHSTSLVIALGFHNVELVGDNINYYFRFSKTWTKEKFGRLYWFKSYDCKSCYSYTQVKMSLGYRLYPILLLGNKNYCHYELKEVEERLYKLILIK